MDTYSINPAFIIDEAIDLSTRLSGTAFPVSIFPVKIQRIIREVHECHNYPTDYIDWKTGSEQKSSAQFCNEAVS